MSHKSDLVGHVVVITGASSGIGRLAALDFAGAGAHVIAAARSIIALRRLEEAAASMSGSITAVEADVTTMGGPSRSGRYGRRPTWPN